MKAGTPLFGFFLPPSNGTVGNDIEIIDSLRACGRLMMMGLLEEKPQYGRWVNLFLSYNFSSLITQNQTASTSILLLFDS